MAEIDRANRDRVAAMSMDEIKEARQTLLDRFGPDRCEFLRRRAQPKASPSEAPASFLAAFPGNREQPINDPGHQSTKHRTDENGINVVNPIASSAVIRISASTATGVSMDSNSSDSRTASRPTFSAKLGAHDVARLAWTNPVHIDEEPPAPMTRTTSGTKEPVMVSEKALPLERLRFDFEGRLRNYWQVLGSQCPPLFKALEKDVAGDICTEDRRIGHVAAAPNAEQPVYHFETNGEDALECFRGLHHHGDEPGVSGYTLPELLHLAQSTVAGQQVLALSTLSNVLRNARLYVYVRRGTLSPIIPRQNDTVLSNQVVSDGAAFGVGWPRWAAYVYGDLQLIWRTQTLVLKSTNINVQVAAMKVLAALFSPAFRFGDNEKDISPICFPATQAHTAACPDGYTNCMEDAPIGQLLAIDWLEDLIGESDDIPNDTNSPSSSEMWSHWAACPRAAATAALLVGRASTCSLPAPRFMNDEYQASIPDDMTHGEAFSHNASIAIVSRIPIFVDRVSQLLDLNRDNIALVNASLQLLVGMCATGGAYVCRTLASNEKLVSVMSTTAARLLASPPVANSTVFENQPRDPYAPVPDPNGRNISFLLLRIIRLQCIFGGQVMSKFWYAVVNVPELVRVAMYSVLNHAEEDNSTPVSESQTETCQNDLTATTHLTLACGVEALRLLRVWEGHGASHEDFIVHYSMIDVYLRCVNRLLQSLDAAALDHLDGYRRDKFGGKVETSSVEASSSAQDTVVPRESLPNTLTETPGLPPSRAQPTMHNHVQSRLGSARAHCLFVAQLFRWGSTIIAHQEMPIALQATNLLQHGVGLGRRLMAMHAKWGSVEALDATLAIVQLLRQSMSKCAEFVEPGDDASDIPMEHVVNRLAFSCQQLLGAPFLGIRECHSTEGSPVSEPYLQYIIRDIARTLGDFKSSDDEPPMPADQSLGQRFVDCALQGGWWTDVGVRLPVLHHRAIHYQLLLVNPSSHEKACEDGANNQSEDLTVKESGKTGVNTIRVSSEVRSLLSGTPFTASCCPSTCASWHELLVSVGFISQVLAANAAAARILFQPAGAPKQVFQISDVGSSNINSSAAAMAQQRAILIFREARTIVIGLTNLAATYFAAASSLPHREFRLANLTGDSVLECFIPSCLMTEPLAQALFHLSPSQMPEALRGDVPSHSVEDHSVAMLTFCTCRKSLYKALENINGSALRPDICKLEETLSSFAAVSNPFPSGLAVPHRMSRTAMLSWSGLSLFAALPVMLYGMFSRVSGPFSDHASTPKMPVGHILQVILPILADNDAIRVAIRQYFNAKSWLGIFCSAWTCRLPDVSTNAPKTRFCQNPQSADQKAWRIFTEAVGRLMQVYLFDSIGDNFCAVAPVVQNLHLLPTMECINPTSEESNKRLEQLAKEERFRAAYLRAWGHLAASWRASALMDKNDNPLLPIAAVGTKCLGLVFNKKEGCHYRIVTRKLCQEFTSSNASGPILASLLLLLSIIPEQSASVSQESDAPACRMSVWEDIITVQLIARAFRWMTPPPTTPPVVTLLSSRQQNFKNDSPPLLVPSATAYISTIDIDSLTLIGYRKYVLHLSDTTPNVEELLWNPLGFIALYQVLASNCTAFGPPGSISLQSLGEAVGLPAVSSAQIHSKVGGQTVGDRNCCSSIANLLQLIWAELDKQPELE
eukprot:GHVT01038930.1.p1 GENE.GHVT01038930.1~~GHVT01038930.1.p1  ORF type:complete len:1669 (-),score=136.28 GHVT01038930.1:2623-7629(-)